jgi:hypothetical protein
MVIFSIANHGIRDWRALTSREQLVVASVLFGIAVLLSLMGYLGWLPFRSSRWLIQLILKLYPLDGVLVGTGAAIFMLSRILNIYWAAVQ